jgi:hypothetical protein
VILLGDFELIDVIEMGPEDINDCCSADIANLQPDDFGRMAGDKALITKVRVLGYNGVTVVACELPNRLIGRTL